MEGGMAPFVSSPPILSGMNPSRSNVILTLSTCFFLNGVLSSDRIVTPRQLDSKERAVRRPVMSREKKERGDRRRESRLRGEEGEERRTRARASWRGRVKEEG